MTGDELGMDVAADTFDIGEVADVPEVADIAEVSDEVPDVPEVADEVADVPEAVDEVPDIPEAADEVVDVPEASETIEPAAAEVEAETATDTSGDESLKFGELEPSTTYERNGCEYQTDEQGRVELVTGKLELGEGVRTSHQTEVGHQGLETDEGGHLIGARFNGSPEGVNLVPQDANLNRGEWKTMENEWADALKEGKNVEVMVQPVYVDGDKRPMGFEVMYDIDKQPFTRVFYNESQKA